MKNQDKEHFLHEISMQTIASGSVKFNDISHWDTSGCINIRDCPEIMREIATMRKKLGYEPINFEQGKENENRKPSLWFRLQQAFQKFRYRCK